MSESEYTKIIWCGNLSEKVNEELLYELFLQAGPLEKVTIAKDRDGKQKNFAFITYRHEVSVPYALRLFEGTALFQRVLKLQGRGCVAALPPPIRFQTEANEPIQSNMAHQFSNMNRKNKEEDQCFSQIPSHSFDSNSALVLASSQSNRSHRHHPYRPHEKTGRKCEDYRAMDWPHEKMCHKRDDYRAMDRPHEKTGRMRVDYRGMDRSHEKTGRKCEDYRDMDWSHEKTGRKREDYRDMDRSHEKTGRKREDYRGMDSYNNNNYNGNSHNQSHTWRDRRNHNRRSYHRRE